MSTTNVYRVDFVISKAAGAVSGPKDLYRKDKKTVLVQAASAHPKDILVPLANNFTLGSGEIFEILAVSQAVLGTEGAGVLQ